MSKKSALQNNAAKQREVMAPINLTQQKNQGKYRH
jgi:hypothetical protein